MSKAIWACAICGEDFTRRSSAERHRNNLHQGRSCIVRFVEYLAGRASGLYSAPIDPPRLTRRERPQFGKTSESDQEIFSAPWWDFGKDIKNDQSGMYSRSASSNQSNNDIWNTVWNTIDEFNRKAQKVLQFKTLLSQLHNYNGIPSLMPVIPAPMNIPSERRFIGFSGEIILGYKGHACKKCLIWNIREIPNEETRILRSYHTCDPQRLLEAQSVTDIPGTIHKQQQELISSLLYVVNTIANQQGEVELIAVEVPAHTFNVRLNNHEENIDLDSLHSVTLGWAYRAAKKGKTTINRKDVQEFLGIFEATLGFFRLTIDGVKRYFFVYIENGLETSDIRCLKLLRVESPTTTEIGIKMSYSAITDEEWKDMFMDGPLTSFPPLRPDKFNFLSRDPTTFDVSKNELDDVRERQEYAYTKSLMQTNG